MSESWQRVQLGSIVEIASGQVDPREPPYREILHVGGDNIQSHTGELSDLKTAAEQGLISGKYLFDERDILYSKIRPSLNKIVAPDFKGICSADIYPVRPIDGKACKNYLVHLLRSDDFLGYAASCSSRTNIPKINREALLAYEATLPPLPEQRRIAAILDKADTIRRKREEGIRLTEELHLSLFDSLFGNQILTDGVIRPLNEVADIASGVAKGRRLSPDLVRTVPYLRVANVQDGFLDLSEIKTIEALPGEVETLRLKKGDIVLTEGGDHDKLGRGALWDHEVPNCIHQNHVFRVRLDRSLMIPEFLVTFLRTPTAKGYFLRCAKKTTNLASINMTQLKGLPVPMVPLDRQVAFARSLNKIAGLVDQRKRQFDGACDLLSSLVQIAFRGTL